MAPLINAAVAVLAVLATVCDTGKYSQYYNSEAVTTARALCYLSMIILWLFSLQLYYI